MLEAFQHQMKHLCAGAQSQPMLIACSGGLDSVVLTHLAHRSKYTIALAHCNFKLRDRSSDQDQEFVKALAAALDVPFFTTDFDTAAFAKSKGVSTQMAARELRYGWFEKIQQQYNYQWLITAHHLNDNLETFMINTGRGTGISGLLGIPSHSDNMIRPLLHFSRKQIQQFARAEKLEWREDQSNATDHYLRNHLRHHAIVNWQKAQPQLLENFDNTLRHLKQSHSLLKVYIEELRQRYCYPIQSVQGPDGMAIDLDQLLRHQAYEAVLYELLAPYGFTAWSDIYELSQSQTGKQIFSPSHRLLKNRNQLEVYALYEIEKQSYEWSKDQNKVTGAFGTLHLEEVDHEASTSKSQIIVSEELLQFPLTVRRWQHGDYFYPLGMEGKKKLSKFFKDEKLSLVAKEEIWILSCAKGIVWIIDHRADNRFKVHPGTVKRLKITHTYETI